MKSQHRHDLQTNELGKVADRFAGTLGPFYEAYGNVLLIGFCIASVAGSLLIYKVRKDRSSDAAAWRELASAQRPEDFAAVREAHPGTSASRWARVQEGENRLLEGVQLLFTNVESGRKELKLARDVLQAVVDEKGAPAEVRERALFSLARCLESMSDGSEADAIKTYESLLREFPGTIYKRDADSRVAALSSGGGQEFYAWFASYARPKPSERKPRDRFGAEMPGNFDDLLENLTPAGDPSKPAAENAENRDAPAEKSSDAAEPPKEGAKPVLEELPAPEGQPEKPPAQSKSP